MKAQSMSKLALSCIKRIEMDRRTFITALGTTTLGMSLPAVAMQSKQCRFIGIGAAGCNFIAACQSGGILSPVSGWTIELMGIDANRETVREFISTFSAWLFDADAIVMVAGLGGDAGSSFMPMMTRLAHETCSSTTVAAIMPFDWEGSGRTRRAATTLRQVARDADLVMHFSNQTLMDSLGDQATLAEHFALQDKNIACNISDLLRKKNQMQKARVQRSDSGAQDVS